MNAWGYLALVPLLSLALRGLILVRFSLAGERHLSLAEQGRDTAPNIILR